MLNSRVREQVQTSLRGIATKANEAKRYRFCDLYRMINRVSLMDAWYDLNKKSAPGVDKITAEEYEKNLLENLINLENRLKSKRYKTKLVKRVYIPKGITGKFRPLGIPALEDKLVQTAAAKILNAIFEGKFLDCSHAYRPGRGAKKAVRALATSLQGSRDITIVDADIKGFFDNLSHDRLIELLERSINDKAFIGLIRKWLKAGILDDGVVVNPEKGTPQGGIVSPVLSNIYLHYVLDIWFEGIVKPRCKGWALMSRYADDYVCAFQYRKDAERFYKAMEQRLKKFGLELSKEKTKLIPFSKRRERANNGFDYLGFEFRWGRNKNGFKIVRLRTSPKRFRRALREFKEWIMASRNIRINKIFKTFNRKLQGHYNYFGVTGNWISVKAYYTKCRRILYKWLNRRSQRRSFNYRGFDELYKYFDVPKPRITEKGLNWSEDLKQSAKRVLLRSPVR